MTFALFGTILGVLSPFITWAIEFFITNDSTKKRMAEGFRIFVLESQKRGTMAADAKASIDEQIDDLKRMRAEREKPKGLLKEMTADELNRQEADKHE